MQPRITHAWCEEDVVGAKSMRDFGGGGGCMHVPFCPPSAQVLARRRFGTCFGREQVPCLLLGQRSHPTEPDVAAPALICEHPGGAREVRRARPVGGRLWSGGARGASRTPGRRSFVAPRRKPYAAHAQLVIVVGPAAQTVRRARTTGDRSWPSGAKRLSIPSEPGTSLAAQARPATAGHTTPIPTSHQLPGCRDFAPCVPTRGARLIQLVRRGSGNGAGSETAS